MPFFQVNPAGSFLSDVASGDDTPPTRINASDYSIQPGQILSLQATGDYSAGDSWDEEENEIIGVFVDASGNFIAPDTFPSVYSQDQWSGLPTNISQDFAVYKDTTHIRVPDGAVSLLLTVSDSYYKDNTDPNGNFGVNIEITDGILSGEDVINWIRSASVTNKDESPELFAFFELIDWSTFTREAWNSVLYLSSNDESLNFTSPTGGSLSVRSRFTESNSSGSDQINFQIIDSSGNELTWSMNWAGSWGANSEQDSGSVRLLYTKGESTSTPSDDISISYDLSADFEGAWGDGYDSGSESWEIAFEISKGGETSGIHYSIGEVNDSGEWFWSEQSESYSWRSSINDFVFEDYSKDISVAFSVTAFGGGSEETKTLQFRDLEASYLGKSYQKDFFELEVGESELNVDFINYAETFEFFESDDFLDLISAFEVTSSSGSSTSSSSGTGSTNVTNATNVTNVTNITNINSGNTTNVNSGNTNTTNNNVAVTVLKNITTYDASVTNDSSVKQTVLGNITNYEGSVSNNVLVGTDGVDQLLGLAGNDRFYSSKGNDTFDGGEGIDGITFNGNRSNFKLTKSGGNWVIQDLREGDTNEGTDTLIKVERLGFGDEAVALDFAPGDPSYNTVMMIGAAFGKALVPTYFGVGVSLFDQGATKAEIAKTIADLKLIETSIGTEDTTAWINHVYKNLVGAAPDPLSLGLVSNLLETGAYTRASLLAFAADLPLLETQVDITGLQSTGLTYTPFI